MQLRERVRRILASRWTIAALVVVGVAIRLRQYVHNRSLWWDEAALAINVMRREFPDLLAVLDYNQSAPPLFLWLTRLAWQLLGESEPVLRLVPLLAGIASLPLFAVAARRLLKPWLVPLALAHVRVQR